MRAQTTEGTDLQAFTEAFDVFVLAARRARARVARDDELTPSQYGLLQPLVDADRSPGVRELASAAGIAAPTATRMLDGLQRRGLVTRERSTADRRAVRLALTAEGARLVRERRASILATRRTLFEQLDPEERRSAARVLARLAEALGEVGA